MIIVEGLHQETLETIGKRIAQDFNLRICVAETHPATPAVARKLCHTSLEMAYNPCVQFRSPIITEFIYSDFFMRPQGRLSQFDLLLYQKLLLRAPVLIIYIRPTSGIPPHIVSAYDHLMWSAPFSTHSVVTHNPFDPEDKYAETVHAKVSAHLGEYVQQRPVHEIRK